MAADFPPALTIGSRVWTEHGYHDHGPLEEQNVNIALRQGGFITPMSGQLYQEDRDAWLVFVEPLAKRRKARVQITKLFSASKRKP